MDADARQLCSQRGSPHGECESFLPIRVHPRASVVYNFLPQTNCRI